MLYSTVSYTADGSERQFQLHFPFLASSHVLVTVDGFDVPFVFNSDSIVETLTAPDAGTTVRVYRVTPTEPLVDFTDGSTLVESDLDTALLQALYLAQEAADLAALTLQATNSDVFDMGGRRIVNVADPIDPQDALTLAYAEENFSIAGSAAANTAAQEAADRAEAARDEAVSAVAAGVAEIEALMAEVALCKAELETLCECAQTFFLSEATPDNFRQAVTETFLSPVGYWNSQTAVGVTDQNNLVVDFQLGTNFEVELGGNRVVDNPLNQRTGQRGFISILQDATGGRHLSWSTQWQFEGGSPPVLTDAGDSLDVVEYVVHAPGQILVKSHLDVRAGTGTSQ